MSASVREFQYNRPGAVSGSLAHDLNWVDPEHQLRHAGQRPEFTVERTGTKVKETVQPKVKAVVEVCQARPMSAVAVLGFVMVAALAVMTIFSYVQLTMLSSQVVELNGTLSGLESEAVTLRAEYSKLFDNASVKAAAVSGGMTEPTNSQMYYMDLSGGDQAEIYQVAAAPTVWEQTSASVGRQSERLLEYFR